MKTVRQNAILNLINEHDVETQEELVRLLNDMGFIVTQATVSRDIKELKLVKVMSDSGSYKYAGNEQNLLNNLDVYVKIFRDTVKSVETAGNLIVLKTISGSASAAAETIDSLAISEVAGTLAGDNTIFVAIKEDKYVTDILKRFKQMMR